LAADIGTKGGRAAGRSEVTVGRCHEEVGRTGNDSVRVFSLERGLCHEVAKSILSPSNSDPKSVSQVFSRGKWDTLILLNILPKLAAHLESDFEVNPRAQDLVPLNRALAWSGLMRESTFAQLMEERFFPKWLDTLHFWLIQPNYNASEVASW
jgi:hypothetical protein